MTRLDDWLHLIDHPDASLPDEAPVDDAIGTLLVHLAFSDGVIQDDEMAFFERIWPGRERSDLVRWVERRALAPVDLEALGPVVEASGGPTALLALAARVVGLDSAVATEEIVHLHRLADHFGVPHEAIREAIASVVAPGGPVETERVESAVASMRWNHLVALPSAGSALVVLGRSAGGAAEVAVERDALWARFDGGEARVPYAEIVSYTRLPVRGRAFHVRTDASDHTLTERPFQDVGRLLDRIYGRT